MCVLGQKAWRVLVKPQGHHACVAETVKPFLDESLGWIGERMDVEIKLSSFTPWLMVKIMGE